MRNTGHYLWFYLFIIEGSLTIFFALVTLLVIPKDIRSAWFLTEDEKCAGETRLLSDSAEGLSNAFSWSEAFLELKTPHPYIRVIIGITYSTLLNSNNNFLAIIVARLGYSAVKTNLVRYSSIGIDAVPDAFSVYSGSCTSSSRIPRDLKLLVRLFPRARPSHSRLSADQYCWIYSPHHS